MVKNSRVISQNLVVRPKVVGVRLEVVLAENASASSVYMS